MNSLNKLKKDFQYIQKPSVVPSAYNQALAEMKRRLIFRKGLDFYLAKLKRVI